MSRHAPVIHARHSSKRSAMLDEHDDIHPLVHGAPRTTEFKKLRKRIVRLTREAIEQYGMIEKGTRWLVCLSGGKDSYTLLAVLHELQMARPAARRSAGVQSGSRASRVFQRLCLPAFLEKDGGAAPDRVQRHLFHRDGQNPCRGGRFAPCVRGCGAGICTALHAKKAVQCRRFGPPPGRHSRDVLYEPVSRRPLGDNATQTAERRRRSVCVPPAWRMLPEADCEKFATAMEVPDNSM